MNNKNSYRSFISGLTAFLLSVFLVVSILVVVCLSTLFNANYMLSELGGNKYYDRIFTALSEELDHLSGPTGIPGEVFTGVINQEQLSQDIDGIIKRAYQAGEEVYMLDRSKLEGDFYAALVSYAQAHDQRVEGELEQTLSYTAVYATDIYVDFVNFPFISEIGSLSKLSTRFLAIVLIAALIVSFALLFCLFMMHVWKHRAVRAVVYALSGAGLMLLLLPAAVLISGKIRYITVSVESLYYFLVGYLEQILWIFLICGLVCLLAAVLLAFLLYRPMRRRAQ